MRRTKSFITALILFLFVLPLTAYAAEDHSNHEVAVEVDNPDYEMDMSGMDHDMFTMPMSMRM